MLYRVWNAVNRTPVASLNVNRRAFFSVASPSEGQTTIRYLKERHRYENFGSASDEFGLEFLSDRGWREWPDAEGYDVLGRPRDHLHMGVRSMMNEPQARGARGPRYTPPAPRRACLSRSPSRCLAAVPRSPQLWQENRTRMRHSCVLPSADSLRSPASLPGN